MINVSNSTPHEGGSIIFVNGAVEQEMWKPSKLHLHNGFSESWKPFLNLCLWRWPRPSLNHVRETWFLADYDIKIHCLEKILETLVWCFWKFHKYLSFTD